MMRTGAFMLVWLSTVSCGAEEKPADLLIKRVNVVDVVNGLILSDRDVVIRGDSLSEILPGGEAEEEGVGQVFSGDGKYLIPGLWDMHAHPDDPEVWRMNPVPASRDLLLPLFVLNGVTGIRDMGGSLAVTNRWRDESRAGKLLAPVILACGPLLDGPDPMWDGSIGIESPKEAAIVADSLVQSGSDFLKVYSLLPRETFFALAAHARRKNIPFEGHVPLSVLPSEAALAGMRSQEHLLEILTECSKQSEGLRSGAISFDRINNPIERALTRNAFLLETFDDNRAKELFDVFRETNSWICPTLSMWYKNAWYEEELRKDDTLLQYLPAYLRTYWQPDRNEHLANREVPAYVQMKRKLLEKYMSVVKQLHSQDVQLLAGTDMGANPLCFPGWSLHVELQLMVKAGLPPEEALRTATVNAARFLGLEKDYGRVEPGMKADLVLLDGDPLYSISNTRRIHAVIRKGKVLSRDSIRRHLQFIRDSNKVRL